MEKQITENDLRVGNWVYDNLLKKQMKVAGISKTDKAFVGWYYVEYEDGSKTTIIDDYDTGQNFITGITLTPELILQAGFEKKPMKHFEWRDSFYVKLIGHQYYGITIGSYDITNPNIGVMYVHHPFEKDVSCPTDEDINNVMDLQEQNFPFAWHIAYLHQLQNIIQSVTGKEIKITL